MAFGMVGVLNSGGLIRGVTQLDPDIVVLIYLGSHYICTHMPHTHTHTHAHAPVLLCLFSIQSLPGCCRLQNDCC